MLTPQLRYGRPAAAVWMFLYCVLIAVPCYAQTHGAVYAEDVRIGILGTDTDDSIVGPGPLEILAFIQSLGADFPIVGTGDFDGSVTAFAGATGIHSLGGMDAIATTEPIVANAAAAAAGVSADGSMTGNASANIATTASAEAEGINVGDGDDTVVNGAPIASTARANATSVAATLAVDGELVSSASPGDAVVEAGTRADADATMIAGGAGVDRIDNGGALAGTATATTTAVAGGLTIGVGTDSDVAAGAALSDGSSVATATVMGIDTAQGPDSISNSGAVGILASATATGVAFGIDVAGSMSGDVESGSAMIDSRTQADASGVGIAGGGDNDSILNSGYMNIGAASNATAVGADLSLMVSEQGNVTSGGGVSEASTTASSNAIGIDGGEGDDSIFVASTSNPGIQVGAISNATGVAVSIGVAGSISGGVDAGDAVSNAGTAADAQSAGISGGGGSDEVTNLTGITSTSASTATAVGVGLAATLNMGGDVTAGGAVSDARTDASATATGISGGEGDDQIDNANAAAILSASAATSTAVGVSLSVSGRIATEETAAEGGGDVSGAAVSDSSAGAQARSVGLAGDAGIDRITNEAGIVSNAIATGVAVDFSSSSVPNVGIEVMPEGDVSGAALSKADVGADASAVSIDGGDDADTIVNSGSIIASSTADATGVAASLSVAGNVSYKGESEDDDNEITNAVEGQALSSATTEAVAQSVGLAGGEGDDGISNEGMILDINAYTNAVGVAASLDVAAGVGIESDAALDVSGAAVSDASVSSESFAAAIDGGIGDDTLTNNNEIFWVRSDAGATGVAAALNVSGNLSYKGDTSGTIEGAAFSDSSTSAGAVAVALSGGEGDDVINSNVNLGTVHAAAGATGVSATLDVAAGLAIQGDVDDAAITGRAVSDATVDADAVAIAIDGGSGVDEITNIGDVFRVEALSGATAVSASLDIAGSLAYKGDTDSSVTGQAVANSTATSTSLAAGITGGQGTDTITNEGDIGSVYAESYALGVSAALGTTLSVTVKGDSDTSVEGQALSRSSVVADATAIGIDGGADDDEIINSGDFNGLVSDATATSVSAALQVSASVTVEGSAEADVTGGALTDTSVSADAATVGLSGNSGDDNVTNSGNMNLLADSQATGVAASLAVTGAVTFKGTQEADVEGSAASDARVTATSSATGIDGGSGKDILDNSGNIVLMAPWVVDANAEDVVDAEAVGVSASLNVAGNLAIKGVATGEVSSVAGSNANVTADAAATGIQGGADDDVITNSGLIFAYPGADATGVAASLSVAGNMLGEATSSAMSESMVVARSSATGIDGGDGDDEITNEAAGAIDLMNQTAVPALNQVDAEATAVSVSLDVAGTIVGEAGGAAIANSQSIADAAATGISGGSGADTITNLASIVADVDSETDTVAVGVSLKVTGNGSAEGAALTDARALSTATATAISGGDGDDTLDNQGNITLNTDSNASATAVSVGLTGSARGTAEGTSLADGSATAISRSVGLDGGAGIDDIDSNSPIVVTHAGAASDSDSVSVNITGAMGLASGSSVANASANSATYSAAVDGGSGADFIDNTSSVIATSAAISEASSTTVGVTFGVGVADTVGTGDSSATATAVAVAVEGGDDDDEITNSGTLFAAPAAVATAGSTTVTVGITAGYAEGDTSATTAAMAAAHAAGLSGGAGDDEITNTNAGTITVGGIVPFANATASSTAVNVGLTVGANVNQTVADTSATALVDAAAITGGAGDDTINNAAVLDVGQAYGVSLATGTADTVSVGVTLGASLGETASNSSANAASTLSGISGDAGSDDVTNTGVINVGLAPPEDLSGLMTVASASSETVDVSVTVGGSFQDASADASANASNTSTGIATGDDDDFIDNRATINAYSSAGTLASGKATKASLTLGVSGGGATSNASSTSTALSAGIDGGAGIDDIDTLADLDVRSWSVATSISTAKDYNILSLGAALQSAEANSAAAAISEARGVYGGSGADDITVGDVEVPGQHTLSVAAASLVNSAARSASISGFGVGVVDQQARAGADTTAHALAIGIDGGEGDDEIVSASAMEVTAFTGGTSIGTSSTNTGFTLGGVSRGESASDASTTILAEAVGIRGGEASLATGETDADNILSVAPITIVSVAAGVSSSTASAESPVTVFGSADGEAMANASAIVQARGTGIEGGAGSDVITIVEDETNSGSISVQSDSTATVSSLSTADATVVFGDASTMGVSDASATVAAESRGISGGDGDDIITSRGTIRVGSLAAGDISAESNVNADVTFGSASSGAMSDASATKYSFSAGIDGGSGADEIMNEALLEVRADSGGTVTSTSTASSDSTFYSASSSTLALAGLEGTTITHGVLGGDGNDWISNSGTVSSVSNSVLDVASLSFATADSTFGDATAVASSAAAATGSATALGIAGGAGDDEIDNDGVLDATARGSTTVTTAVVTIADSTFGDEFTFAQSSNFSKGMASTSAIDGGDGDDTIVNNNLVNAAAESDIQVLSLTLSSDGPAISDARTIAAADAAGISGGAGNDEITNNSVLLVSARPRVLAATRTQGGLVGGSLGVDLIASASGIRGGDGDDVLVNAGDIVAVAGRQSTSTISALVDAESSIVRDSSRVGEDPAMLVGKWVRVDLEGPEDFYTTIVSFDQATGEISFADPLPEALVAGITYTVLDLPDGMADIGITTLNAGGAVFVDAKANSTVAVIGLSGGEGIDDITNTGSVRAAGSSSILIGNFEIGYFVDSDLRTTSTVQALGLDGEIVSNQGTVDVLASALTRADGATISVFGSSVDQRGIASANALGIEVGASNSSDIENQQNLNIQSVAEIRATKRVFALFSTGDQELSFESDSVAVGISSSAGDDSVINFDGADVNVEALAAGSIQGVSTSYRLFGIGTRTENIVDASADATAYGLDLGGGENDVENFGNLTVHALARPSDPAMVGAFECGPNACVARAVSDLNNETSASANAETTARARGIRAEGDDTVVNTGRIEVLADSLATSYAQAGTIIAAQDQSAIEELHDSDTTRFFDESLQGLADDELVGKRLRFPNQPDLDFLEAESTVEAIGSGDTADQFTDTSYAGDDPVGMRVRFGEDEDFVSTVTEYNPDTGVFTLAADVPSGVTLEEGDYSLSIIAAEIVAFDSSTGEVQLSNPLPPDVDVGEAYTLSIVSSVTGSDTFQDDSRVGEIIPANTIVTFGGVDSYRATVLAFDTETGEFTLDQQVPDELMTDAIYTLSSDVTEGSSGSDAQAFAIGIDLGDGDATVISDGTLEVHARAVADTRATGGLAAATAKAIARAQGVETHAGNDTIENNGVLRVTAEVAATSSSANIERSALAIGIDSGTGDDLVINDGELIVQALINGDTTTGTNEIGVIGITTGDGDDGVTNLGIVSALAIENGVTTEGTAIDLGAGNDTLTLGANSMTTGSVLMGAGDDVLQLSGNPVIMTFSGDPIDPLGGAGIDTLSLNDGGSFASVPLDFERGVKYGEGQFELVALPTMQYLRVEDGELSIASDYAFASDSLYETVFYTDGHNGQLLVDGLAELGGTIDVARSGDEYIADGTRYELITATGAVSNAFAEMILPEAMPLLHFELEQDPANLDLVAVAASFDTVAENLLQQRIASNLDGIAGGASGTFARTLGHLQTLPDGFGRALQSFSPDIHQVANEGATQVMQQGTAILQSHLRTTRTRYRDGGNAPQPIGQLAMFYSNAGYGGVTMTQAASSAVASGYGPRQTRSQSWALGMASRGDYDAVSGYTGFEQDTDAFAVGYDFNVNDRLVVGLSVGAADTTIEMFDAYGTGSVDGWSANVYGTWFTSDSYLEWGIGYGEHDIIAARAIELGTDVRSASSDHDGDALSLVLGGGKAFRFDRWFVEPFAAVRYFRLAEDAFEESGAGDMSQMIASRDTTALFGDVGVNVGQRVELQSGNTMFDWNLMAGINHDFDIDDRPIDYAYVGQPTEWLSLAGRHTADTSMLLGGTLAWYGERLGMNLEYRGRFNSDYDEQAIAAIFLLQF